MVTISFIKGMTPIATSKNSNLMETLTSNGIAVGSSCGGEGICTKCALKITEGAENLSDKNENEKAFDLEDGLRLSCQTQVLGNITVDADYW